MNAHLPAAITLIRKLLVLCSAFRPAFSPTRGQPPRSRKNSSELDPTTAYISSDNIAGGGMQAEDFESLWTEWKSRRIGRMCAFLFLLGSCACLSLNVL